MGKTVAMVVLGSGLVIEIDYSSLVDAMLALDPFCNVWGACAVRPDVYDVEPPTVRSGVAS